MQELGLVVVIVILGLVLTIWSRRITPDGPNPFFNFDNLINRVVTPMSVYAIMAVGMTFVIISGGIDISVGSIFTLSALFAARALERFDVDAPAWKVLATAFCVAPGIGLLCGMLNGLLVTQLRLHPFIVTLGTMSIFAGLCNVTNPIIKTLPSGDNDLPAALSTNLMQRYYFATSTSVGVRLMPMVFTLACVIVGWFFLRMMIAGRETYAVGGNEEAARFSGLKVNWIKLRVYMLSGLAAGIAGVVSLGRFGTISTNTGAGYELTVVAAAVVGGASLLGGRGTALGALLGALVIRMIENGIDTLKLNQEYSMIIVGSAIIVAAAIDRFSEHLSLRRHGRRT